MKGIAATGFLVGFANRKDRFHDWALSIAEQIDGPLLTCEAVLAEAAFHIGSASQVFGIVRDGLVRLAFDCSGHFAQLEALAARYADRQPDLADLCLIRMSELFPDHPVITVDREDFQVYRRNKREVIPIICPARTIAAWRLISAPLAGGFRLAGITPYRRCRRRERQRGGVPGTPG